jgi:hypothetical protein
VRAHLRTCDGCREYATSVRRRAGQPVRSLSAWSPLAGYQLLESVFRAAAGPTGAAMVQGGSSLFAPLAAKAAAATVVLAAGLGAADVATMKTGRDAQPARPATAAAAKQARHERIAASTVAATPAAARARLVPAVYSGGRSPVEAKITTPARRSSRSTATPTGATTSKPRQQTAPTSPDPEPQREPAPREAPRASRTQPDPADCDGSSPPAREDGSRPAPQQDPPPEQQETTRAVAYTGPHQPHAR